MTTFVNNDVSSGNVIYASDHNTQGALIANVLNGGIEAENLASNAVTTAKIADANVTTAKLADASVTNAKLSTTAGEVGGAWQSWTPSYTNLTVGSGTVTAKYTQIGKTVHFSYQFVYGSGSSVGTAPTISLPVTASAELEPISAYALDNGTTRYPLLAIIGTATTISIFGMNASNTLVMQNTITSTSPMTWATGDTLSITGTYQAA